MRLATPLHLMPRLNLAKMSDSVMQSRATISTPRSWAATLGATQTFARFPNAISSNENKINDKKKITGTEAEHTFDIFSQVPATFHQWQSLKQQFMSNTALIIDECETMIQKSRMDLLMRVQGRASRRRAERQDSD